MWGKGSSRGRGSCRRMRDWKLKLRNGAVLVRAGCSSSTFGDTLSPSPAGPVISLQHSQARPSTYLGQGSRMESPAGLTVELDPHIPSVRDPVHGPCLANELWTKKTGGESP